MAPSLPRVQEQATPSLTDGRVQRETAVAVESCLVLKGSGENRQRTGVCSQVDPGESWLLECRAIDRGGGDPFEIRSSFEFKNLQ